MVTETDETTEGSTETSEKTDAQVLREAARHIEKVGLNQDGLYFKVTPEDFAKSDDDLDYKAPLNERPCCALGGVMAVQNEWPFNSRPYTNTQFKRLEHYLDRRVELLFGWPSVTLWNDEPTTELADVTALLYAAATELDLEGGGYLPRPRRGDEIAARA